MGVCVNKTGPSALHGTWSGTWQRPTQLALTEYKMWAGATSVCMTLRATALKGTWETKSKSINSTSNLLCFSYTNSCGLHLLMTAWHHQPEMEFLFIFTEEYLWRPNPGDNLLGILEGGGGRALRQSIYSAHARYFTSSKFKRVSGSQAGERLLLETLESCCLPEKTMPGRMDWKQPGLKEQDRENPPK